MGLGATALAREAKIPIAGVVVGTQGTILRRFTFDPVYDVCFDGYPAPRLVNKRDLAPAPPEKDGGVSE